MWYNENWHKEVSSVDVVDKKWRDIVWVKEEDIRRQAIEYLNKEENRKLPPHEFNSLVFRIKEYLRKVDNDRSVIDHKFEWLRRWIVAEIRASKNTLRREIDSRNIDEISKIRNPWDLSRYIDQSWDKALITLKEVLGTDNILSLAWLWLSYGTIELWRWLADILKLWEEFVKAYDDLKNWDFMAKDKLKLILKTLGIEWLRLLCVIPFGRAVVWKIKIFLQEWKKLWKQEKVVLIGQELLEKYKKTIDLWEKVLWRKLNLREKSVIIRAHEIWTPINWKYDYKDIDKKYRLLRTVFDENQSRKLIESRVCGKFDVGTNSIRNETRWINKINEWTEVKIIWDLQSLKSVPYTWNRFDVNNAFTGSMENMDIYEFFRNYKDFKIYFNEKISILREKLKTWEDINKDLSDIYEVFNKILIYCRNWIAEYKQVINKETGLPKIDLTIPKDELDIIIHKWKSINWTILNDNELWEIIKVINKNVEVFEKNKINISQINDIWLRRILIIFKTLK